MLTSETTTLRLHLKLPEQIIINANESLIKSILKLI